MAIFSSGHYNSYSCWTRKSIFFNSLKISWLRIETKKINRKTSEISKMFNRVRLKVGREKVNGRLRRSYTDIWPVHFNGSWNGAAYIVNNKQIIAGRKATTARFRSISRFASRHSPRPVRGFVPRSLVHVFGLSTV